MTRDHFRHLSVGRRIGGARQTGEEPPYIVLGNIPQPDGTHCVIAIQPQIFREFAAFYGSLSEKQKMVKDLHPGDQVSISMHSDPLLVLSENIAVALAGRVMTIPESDARLWNYT